MQYKLINRIQIITGVYSVPQGNDMTYRQQLVATIKVGGKILRENNNQVKIPFGAEYSIYIKNLDSVRCQFKVSIDGKNATSDNWIIVEPNSSVELERSINNGNFNKGNKFKFIERTTDIENHRGIKADDGLVRIEYQFEKRWPKQEPIIYPEPYKPWVQPLIPNPYDKWPYNNGIWCQSNIGSTYNTAQGIGSSVYTTALNNCDSQTSTQHMNSLTRTVNTDSQSGITVPGSESYQKFTTGSWFFTENETHVIVLSLTGKIANKPVEQPITVDYKPTCVSCGLVNKVKNKFCGRCGTALHII